MADEQTISIPQLLLVLLIGGLVIRYFFFSGQASRMPATASNNRARETDVERIQQMFPQIPRRTLMWDLQRNGGNIAATTERILSSRGLETPPQSFQPPLPAQTPSSSSSRTSTPAVPKPLQPDLISRYNLSAKITSPNAGTEEETASSPGGSKQGWSQNKGERQALLQRRREEMILTARRRMEARLAAEQSSADGNPIIR